MPRQKNNHTKLKKKVHERDNYTCKLNISTDCKGDMREAYARYKNKQITRKRLGLTVDHEKPLAKGGEWTMENLVTACAPCNNMKSDTMKHLDEVMEFLHQSNLIEGVDTPVNRALVAWQMVEREEKITTELLLNMHKTLLRKLAPGIAGKYRDCNVRVGAWIAPAWFEVPNRMAKWIHEANITDFGGATKKVKGNIIKQMHVEFEKIHPFEDGNGRIGRILMNWQRVKNGLPILIIHEGDEQQEYYKWFK